MFEVLQGRLHTGGYGGVGQVSPVEEPVITGSLVLVKYRQLKGLLGQPSGSAALVRVRGGHEVLRALYGGVDTGLVLPSHPHNIYTVGISGDQMITA